MSKEYYVKRGDKIRGPISEQKLRKLKADGKLQSTDLISTRSDGGWRAALGANKSTSRPKRATESPQLPPRGINKRKIAAKSPKSGAVANRKLMAGFCVATVLMIGSGAWFLWPSEPSASVTGEEIRPSVSVQPPTATPPSEVEAEVVQSPTEPQVRSKNTEPLSTPSVIVATNNKATAATKVRPPKEPRVVPAITKTASKPITKRVLAPSKDPNGLFEGQRQRLARPVAGDWNVSEMSLREAATFISEREKIPVWLNEDSLPRKMKPESLVNLSFSPGPLGPQIQERLGSYGLALVPPLAEEGDWEITTLKNASKHFLTLNYDVSDAVNQGFGFQDLLNLIQSHIQSRWIDIDGEGGRIDIENGQQKRLKVTQSWAAHNEITILFEKVRQGPTSTHYQQFLNSVTRLRKPIVGKWVFQDVPLSEVLLDIGGREKLAFRIDAPELDLEGLSPRLPVTHDSAAGSLGDSLSALLKPSGLTVLPLQGNSLQWTVTSIPKAGSSNAMFTVIHPLKMTAPPPFTFSGVINSVMALPNTSWMDTEGEGGTITLVASRSGAGLAVTQTWDVQSQIVQLLR